MYEYDNKADNLKDSQSTAVALPSVSKEQAARAKKSAKKAERKRTWKKIGVSAIVGLVFGVTAAGAFKSVSFIADKILVPKPVQEQPKESVGEPKEIPEIKETAPKVPESAEVVFPENKERVVNGMGVENIVKQSMPAVVSITNKSVQQVRSMFGTSIQEYENTSVGSGIILGENDTELLIVTNNHVIEGANTLTVGFVDDEIYEAYVKGTEADRDLAVIAVKLSDLDERTLGAISIATLGDSSELEVGEQVVAIGNALGYGQSVTTGIVSALDREVTIENITNDLIQTDAAINPGNSGGALINMRGELIGINSAKFASSAVEGMGYAIPIDTVKPIVEELMNRQARELLDAADAGYLGITGLNVDASVSKTYGIPEGVYLQEITEGSPADDAGLIKGDVVTKFDGTSVRTIAELKEMLLYYKPGEEVKVTFYRADDGEYTQKTVMVTLGDRKGTALDPDMQTESNDNAKEDDKDNSDDSEKDKESSGNGGYYSSDDIMSQIESLLDMFR